ncbi:DUF4065 domain-containing protein [Burkholderia cenocepacia]|nr:DUF4065 domain-containing protein [Burkholderia cenocepacia]RQV70439.1 DUF4065 domain-containing protein [Burkholderia cenocepacia]
MSLFCDIRVLAARRPNGPGQWHRLSENDRRPLASPEHTTERPAGANPAVTGGLLSFNDLGLSTNLKIIMTQLTIDYFDVKKAGQLVFYFLHQAETSGKNITKLRLAKWLYLAERASYQEFGEPMLGDRLAAMKHGPAPSEVVAILEGKSRSFPRDIFDDIITVSRPKGHQYVSLAEDCIYSSTDDLDRFSDAEIELLDSIWKEYGNWSAVRLENYLHDTKEFPEWNWKEGDKTNWIELENLLSIVGFPDDEIGLLIERILAFRPNKTN